MLNHKIIIFSKKTIKILNHNIINHKIMYNIQLFKLLF